MPRRAVVRAMLALALVAAVVITAQRALSSECATSRRLDHLLGGGAAACLGQSLRPVAHMPGMNRSSGDSSDNVYLDLEGRRYWYRSAGARNLLVARVGARVGSACVELPSGTADSVALVAVARLGGDPAVRDTLSLGRVVRNWSWHSGDWVHSNRDNWVCVGASL